MKLDRDLPGNAGRGKYALLLLRRLENYSHGTFQELDKSIESAIRTLDRAGLLDWGNSNTESEFFLIRLKDKYASEALEAYANEAGKDDPEYADEIRKLADRAGPKSSWCKRPD